MELVFKNHATVLRDENISQQSHKIKFPINFNAFFKNINCPNYSGDFNDRGKHAKLGLIAPIAPRRRCILRACQRISRPLQTASRGTRVPQPSVPTAEPEHPPLFPNFSQTLGQPGSTAVALYGFASSSTVWGRGMAACVLSSGPHHVTSQQHICRAKR